MPGRAAFPFTLLPAVVARRRACWTSSAVALSAATSLNSRIWRSRASLRLLHWRSKTAAAILWGWYLPLVHYRRGNPQRSWRRDRAGLGLRTETLPGETRLRSRLFLQAGRRPRIGRGR